MNKLFSQRLISPRLTFKAKLIIVAGLVLAALFFAKLIVMFGALSILVGPVLLIGLVLAYFIFREPTLGWLLIVFFLPFERVPTINIGGTDLKINTVLGLITLFAWILALMASSYAKASEDKNPKKWKVEPNALAIPLSLFAAALIASLMGAVNLPRAITVLIFILFTMALAVLTVNMVNSKEALRKTIVVLFASALVAGAFGLFQFGGDIIGLPSSITLLKEGYTKAIFGFPRIQAFSMEPLYYANYLLIPICIGIALIFNKAEPFKRWFFISIVLLLLINFILTVSRGGYLGLVGSVAVLGILMFRKIFTWRNILIGIFAIGIVGYGVAFALSKGDYQATNEFIGHVMVTDFKNSESVQGRLLTYRRAYNAYKWYPVFGIGIGNYGPFAKFYPSETPQKGWDIVNNQYIELLAETGLVGTVAFGFLILVLSMRTFIALKYARDLLLRSVLIGAFAALVGILIQYNFMSTLYIIHIWILIGLLIAVQNIILSSKSEILNPKS